MYVYVVKEHKELHTVLFSTCTWPTVYITAGPDYPMCTLCTCTGAHHIGGPTRRQTWKKLYKL